MGGCSLPAHLSAELAQGPFLGPPRTWGYSEDFLPGPSPVPDSQVFKYVGAPWESSVHFSFLFGKCSSQHLFGFLNDSD